MVMKGQQWAPLQGFSVPYFAQRHETGHFGLGNVDFAAEIGLVYVGNDAINTEIKLSRGRGAATMDQMLPKQS